MDSKSIGAFVASGLLCASSVRAEEVATSEAEELDELTVIGSRIGKEWINASGTVLQVSDDELLKTGAQDLAGFAKYDPTVSLPFDFSSGDGAFAYGQSGYGSINIRGIEGNRIAIELDGVRQAPQYVSTSFDMGEDGGAGGVGRDYFDPAMFEMIEVLKGGASALYGSDALGGVVSFRTPEPKSFLGDKNGGGLLRTQYFSVNDSFAAQAGGAVRYGDTSIMLLSAYRNGNEVENNGNVPPNPAVFDSAAILLKAEHVYGDHTFKAALELFERDSFIDARSAAESDFVLFDDYVHNEQFLERQRLSFRWNYEPVGGGWVDALETHAYWQHSGSTSKSDSASKPLVIGGMPIPGTANTRQQTIQFDTDILGLSVIGRREFNGGGALRHLFMSGLDLSVEESANAFDRVNNGLPDDRISFAPSDTHRAGIFFQDEVTIHDNWFVTPGLRFDWQRIEPNPSQGYLDRIASMGGSIMAPPEDYDNLAISPRLTVAWKPRDTMQWYANYAHGVRNPTAEELSMIFTHPDGGNGEGTTTVPNPNLEEEKSDAFEVGFKAENEGGRFQSSVFYTRYSNFIENGVATGEKDDLGRDIVTTLNRGKAEIYGFEVGGVLNAGHWWSAAEGWSVGLTTGKSVGLNRTEHTWLNSVEPWKTVAFVGYEDPGGKFGARLTGIYTDEVTRVDDTTNQTELYRPPAWFTLDLGAYWRPQETLTINVGLNNIFDEKYWAWGSVRRGGGHLGGNSVTERSTAPGRNFSISLTKTF